MPSLQSQLFIFLLSHSHLLQLQLKRKPIEDTPESIAKFRQQVERGAPSRLPEGIVRVPASAGNRYAEWIRPVDGPKDRAILYFHGGGYISGSCPSHRRHVVKFVQGCGIGAFLFDYRLAPEHPFPAALDDALAAYQTLLAEGHLPEHIVFAGDSAGGGLVFATLLALCEHGLPLPAAAVVLSPWTDLNCTGDSLHTRASLDVFTPAGAWTVFSKAYIGSADRCHPWISPLYGDLHGLPPLLIYAAGHDVLVDDSTRFAEKARLSGVDVTLRVGEGMFHCYPALSPLFPEARQAMDEICAFIKTHV